MNELNIHDMAGCRTQCGLSAVKEAVGQSATSFETFLLCAEEWHGPNDVQLPEMSDAQSLQPR